MEPRMLVEEFIANPARFRLLGEGDRGGAKVYLAPNGVQVIKTYAPHPNKLPPLERARHEYSMIQMVSDLPCAPKGAALVEVGGQPYLIREAGTVPEEITLRIYIQISDFLEALAARRICLCDTPQVALRPDGSVFVYDWDFARYVPVSRGPWDIVEEEMNDGMRFWLRDAGYPAREHRAVLKKRAAEFRKLAEKFGGKLAQIEIQHAEDIEAQLRREDALRKRLASGEVTDLPIGLLFTVAEWQQVKEDAEREIERIERSGTQQLEQERLKWARTRYERALHWIERLSARVVHELQATGMTY